MSCAFIATDRITSQEFFTLLALCSQTHTTKYSNSCENYSAKTRIMWRVMKTWVILS
ncbi:hypothetical protein HMPREF1248_0795 [Coriobacteriaceae bacterium BV3Ac1]|nr:hypothetical protein HMPREF1248_0795 [Coriobacteriaceae bacterium BV3Ac1]